MGKQPIEIKEPRSIKEVEKFGEKKFGALKKNTMKRLNGLRERERKKEQKRLDNKNWKTSN